MKAKMAVLQDGIIIETTTNVKTDCELKKYYKQWVKLLELT
jgi:hypothetical protein